MLVRWAGVIRSLNKNLGIFSSAWSNSINFGDSLNSIKEMKEKLDDIPELKDFAQNTQILTHKNGFDPTPFQNANHEKVQPLSISPEEKKSALRDNFGRFYNYLRISLTERCNFRCIYCMPEGGVELQSEDKLLSNEEVIETASLFSELGSLK